MQRDEEIKVTLPDGETTPASIVGRDAATDLVALRIKGKAQAAPRGVGNDAGSLRVGALVLAVGRPGRNATASFGIVSAVGEGWRTWEGSRLDRVLRLDLAVYDGFSGGALVDASGAVLGVNNSALARGTPMALPAGVVDRVVDELLARGHVRRPFIGVAVQPVALPATLAKQLTITQDAALLLTSVADDSPAERAGLYVGDVLLDANGQALHRPTDLLDALANAPAGSALALRLLRGGTATSISVTPADRREVK